MLHSVPLRALAFFVLSGLAACASAPPPAPAAPESGAVSAKATTTGASEAPKEATASEPGTSVDAPYCDLVCQRAAVERRKGDDPDYHARATENANQVLGTMQSDLLACYKKRVRANPNAHGFITVDVIIGPDGRVLRVETTGGAVLGEATMGCIVHRIEKGVFDPPHGGGTLRIQVPFGFRRVAEGEEV